LPELGQRRLGIGFHQYGVHTHAAGGVNVAGKIVEKHSAGGIDTAQLGQCVLKHGRVGLADPQQAGVGHGVEELVYRKQALPGVAELTNVVGNKGRVQPGGAYFAHAVNDHLPATVVAGQAGEHREQVDLQSVRAAELGNLAAHGFEFGLAPLQAMPGVVGVLVVRPENDFHEQAGRGAHVGACLLGRLEGRGRKHPAEIKQHRLKTHPPFYHPTPERGKRNLLAPLTRRARDSTTNGRVMVSNNNTGGGQARNVAIIGSGFSGLCLGIKLKRAGIDDFTIFEKSDRLGGTWRDNTYPGACCDVPSVSYSFSFEQKLDWTRLYAGHGEILSYMEHCADKYGLRKHIQLDTEIADARWDEDSSAWQLTDTNGEQYSAAALVCGTGQLNRPTTPDLKGLGDFAGDTFHSARWQHDCELEGRDVVVVGNAASAIQFIPRIARQARNVTVLQRTPNWMIPRNDREYTKAELQRFRRYPWLARIMRWFTWAMLEARFPMFLRNRLFSAHVERQARRHMEDNVNGAELRDVLVPDYPIGAKRLLVSDDYYQSLNRDNVHLVTDVIDRVEKDAVVTADGKRHPADVLVMATGFKSTGFFAPMNIVGRGEESLNERWAETPCAYLGMTVPGFPNFFTMYGPNTNLGHNSIIFMIECQAGYIASLIDRLFSHGLASLELKGGVLEAWDRRVQQDLENTVWADVDRSWYKNAAGRVTNNWSGTTTRYWWLTRRSDFDLYDQVARGS